MTDVAAWLVTALVVALLVAFVLALLSLREIPLGERPRTPLYDRLGRQIAVTENPDYHENPGEDHGADPDHVPRPGQPTGERAR
ncbi:MAG: hypothetical protein IRY97_12380 [Thermomicrobiaceae bacterium]|nr:hypothetical protein [Thermomicrobiaceae bacterium]